MLYDITNSILYIEISIPPEQWLEPGNYRLWPFGGGGGVVQKIRHSMVLIAVKKTPQETERLNRVVINNLFLCLLHYL